VSSCVACRCLRRRWAGPAPVQPWILSASLACGWAGSSSWSAGWSTLWWIVGTMCAFEVWMNNNENKTTDKVLEEQIGRR
jgi:hypothetical protein